MDTSIRPVTPAMQFDRGADAFDRGLGIDDHNMNPGSSAIADWQMGWECARHEAERARESGDPAGQQLEPTPP